ncbi:hypothetical protein BEWA_030510 [Theileria equi strain WA]|uniref:Endonuclease/exonuclease/phosphatase domain-containing protein n=1 Tax=Theileria equi strain WA TaxID=1537102 RepID=L0AY59_THEEQ|nr:hypothetical protein BEWA_030510 [Theileria equi strain WA]AFZ80198.1 hypothetical protein BEWA_030510 [Theileria equi strain WA]|eukprot:XP_004829864.1 hypothetical protein BEWA_030510 [Theileria equi strain WA]
MSGDQGAFECSLRDGDSEESPCVARDVDSYGIESFHTSSLSSFKESYDRLESFSMLTFNAGLFEFRLFGMGLYHNPPFTTKRLKHIPGKLRRANADVVAIQEIYLKEHANFIIKELIDLYPYATRDSYIPNDNIRSIFVEDKGVVRKNNKMGIPLLHSGLLFLSKFPIIGAKFHPWIELTYLEAMFSNKGFLEVLVNIPTIGKVAFYNMHMASASINPESRHIEELRLEEVKQLLATTESTSSKGFIPIIIGDLNAAPNTCASNYTYFIDKGWGDSYLMAKNFGSGSRKWSLSPTNKNDQTEKRKKKRISIDPVFGTSEDSIGNCETSSQDAYPPFNPDVSTGATNRSETSSSVIADAEPATSAKQNRWSRFFKDATLWRNIRSVYSDRSNTSTRKGKISIKRVALPRRTSRSMRRKTSKILPLPCDSGVTKTFTLNHSKTFKVRRGSQFDEDGFILDDDLKPISGRSNYEESNSTCNLCGEIGKMCGGAGHAKRPWRRKIYKPFFVISHKGKSRWWRRKTAKSYTWDPENPLNKIGPHSSCNGLRCDYIFLPPADISGNLADYVPKSSEILFKDPTVAIHRNKSGCGCIFSMLSSFERVMLVTLSDHYALKIVMTLK